MKNKYRGGRPKGVKNNTSSTHTGERKWETEEQKAECWARAKDKVKELGYQDNYGGSTPSEIKKRLNTNASKTKNEYTYKGDLHHLWGMNLSDEELLDIAYGEKK